MKFPVSFYQDLKVLEEQVPFHKQVGVHVEVALADTAFNQEISVRQLEKLAVILRENELKVTAHLPFHDLRLASRDRHIVEYSMDVLTEALEIGKILGARMAVLHTGYTPQVPTGDMEKWMEEAAGNLRDLAERAAEEDMLIALRNLWEPDADLFKGLFERVGNESLGMCPDLGHAACYSSLAPEEWITVFNDRLFNIHFHDNDGMEDQHNSCGEGVVGYDTILEAMQGLKEPLNITLEMAPEGILPSLDHLREMGFDLDI
ncbi:MAG: sugar phosphate isomerase/epimerase [Candidatus Eisenbacteria bacterium]|uniref:Sugar phosphate isomerase/epimerase n=1 Tax=Eiseniibacteriota bacterium TaxID=2212470 RepID=A0A948WAX5_UNCEI|nr:sugar phosphate isomerase/epimerase [Candidatus Eisenbacteria bacterium]MBU1949013.1 sugar phosphate isomerase/epimerase [Candidatus Eisenbacteria bacterium]MBU2689453.1 sugar phosphate isomerase/epimerase [Candidatus Eisenbacteria bacterium]